MAKITNREVSSLFATIGDMLEIKGESIHRILAYRRAGETIANLPRDLNTVFEEGKLTDLPGIGETLAEKIEELLTTGELGFYNKLAEEIPPGVIEMLRVPGLGAKKAARFWKEAGITTLEQLKEAAQAGKLRDMSGMGAKSEAVILEGIESLARRTDRLSIGDARPIAMRMLEQIEQALVRSAKVDADRIKVEVEGNKAILRGTVRSWVEREEAERAAWAAPGILSVENRITISP